MTIWNPVSWWMQLLDAMPDWDPDPPEPGELEECAAGRQCADDLENPFAPGEPPAVYPVVDLEAEAAKVTYPSGKVKRTRFPRANLANRKVVIALHQMGVERADSSTRWKHVTAHRVIAPAGRRLRLHPLDVRLVCTNRLDRHPWHAIGIEVAGNFEETDGDGRWWKPEIYGRGRAGEAQLEALRQEIRDICLEVRAMGGDVIGIVPHRVAGQSKGKPNRPLCCGSRVWIEAGEFMAHMLELAVPAPGWTIGGLPIPTEWRPEWRNPNARTRYL